MAVHDARTELEREFLTVARRSDVDAFDFRLLRSHVTRLELGIVGEVAHRQNDAVSRAKSVPVIALDTDD